jgi:dipeptidyl-peptidase 4
MPDPSQLTLDRIFTDKEFETKSFGPIRWLDGGRGYTTLEEVENQPGDENNASKKDKVKEIIRYDTESGERTVLVNADQLRPPGAEEPLVIKDYAWSDDKQRLLIFTNTQKVWRLETRGDYWVLDLEPEWLWQLGGEGRARPA